MTTKTGGHDSRTIASGETVHLVRHPDTNWKISSYDWSWTNGLMLWNARVFSQTIAWDNLQFATVEEAYVFAEQEIAAKRVPSRSQH